VTGCTSFVCLVFAADVDEYDEGVLLLLHLLCDHICMIRSLFAGSRSSRL
jgi:hypothetical protein